jgi:hypothetical protein
MSVEQQVDALATSVEILKSAVVSKKATLDASVVDARSATAQAQNAKTNALSARDQAGAFKDAAYTAAQSAASAVAYQDLTALAMTKDVTTVDVFIYDTSKDSDGGAWRHRCAGTSWYREELNTATRGSRRGFPAVAVIVAETSRVTIYDGDDPALPMWATWPAGLFSVLAGSKPITSLAMKNGLLAIGRNGDINFAGLSVVDLVGDRAEDVRRNGAGRNYSANSARAVQALWMNVDGFFPVKTGSAAINNVAITALPDAAIDPATGLPAPTIAVASTGGVSVIKADGNVWNITGTNWGATSTGVGFVGGELYFVQGTLYWLAVDITGLNQDHNLFDGYNANNDIYPFKRIMLDETIAYASGSRAAFGGASFDLAHASGLAHPGSRLTLHKRNPTGRNLVAYVTSSFNTGWLPGAIRGSFLADTDDTDLVGGDLAINGSLEANADGWTLGADWAYDAEHQRISRVGTTYHNLIPAATIATLETGKAYVLEVERGGGQVGWYTNNSVYGGLAVGVNEIPFTYTGGNYPFFYASSADGWINNFKIYRADHDRSINNRGLIINGTVNRAPAAPGAEMVACSGFSASNYLEQPYNPVLEFGIGDFCVMGWFSQPASAMATIMDRFAAGRTGAGIEVRIDTNARLFVFTQDASGAASYVYGAAGSFAFGAQNFFAVVRRAGSLELYINATRLAEQSSVTPTTARDISVSGTTRVGSRVDGALPFNGSLSLLRIGATASTADQIHRIYQEEMALFQENAACTLYGASDAVTALAHDPDTGLLHIGTSAGRSVFQGLRRVANTMVPVTTAIAAAGGIIVEQ